MQNVMFKLDFLTLARSSTTTRPLASPAASSRCAGARARQATSPSSSAVCSRHCHPGGCLTVVNAGAPPLLKDACNKVLSVETETYARPTVGTDCQCHKTKSTAASKVHVEPPHQKWRPAFNT